MPEASDEDDDVLGQRPSGRSPIDEALSFAEFLQTRLGIRSPPVTLGRFAIVRKLGSGAHGDVYVASDAELERSVALKVLRHNDPPPAWKRRFRNEAQSLARMSHPNVVQIFGSGESRWGLWIAMELVDGQSLASWQRSVRDVSWRAVVAMYREAGEGLAAAHSAGLVHRDIKPSNILVGRDGRIRVADFGLSASRDVPVSDWSSSLTSGRLTAVTVGGTPGYAAPEQISAQTSDTRSDQFSFCVALYESLAGRRPFTPKQIEAMAQTRCAPSLRAIGRGVPRSIGRVVARGLAVEANDRWPDMNALLGALDNASTRKPTSLAVLLFGVVGVASAYEADEPNACAEEATMTLSASRRADLLRSPDGTPSAMSTYVVHELERYAAAWTATRLSVCAGVSPEAGRLRCLNRQRELFDEIAETLSHRQSLESRPDRVLEQLVPPSSCVDDRGASGFERGDSTSDLLRTIDRGRLELAAGALKEATATADDAVVAAQRTNSAMAMAEAKFLEALVLDELGLDARAGTAYGDAAGHAASARLEHRAPEIHLQHARMLARDRQDLERAEEELAHAIAAIGRLERVDALLADVENVQAVIAAGNGDHLGALRLRESALSRLRQTLPEHAPRVTDAVVALANARADAGETEAAGALYLEALEARRAVLGDAHPDTATVLFDLALIARTRGEFDVAHERFTEALDIQMSVFGRDSVRVAPALYMVAESALELGQLERARKHAELAWAIQKDHLPIEHTERTASLAVLALAHEQAQDWGRMLEVNLLILGELPPSGQEEQEAGAANNVAFALCESGRCDEAEPYYRRILALGASDPVLPLLARAGLGRVAAAAGRTDEALAVLSRVVDELRDVDCSNAPLLPAEVQLLLAELLEREALEPERVVELATAARVVYRANGIDAKAERADALVRRRRVE